MKTKKEIQDKLKKLEKEELAGWINALKWVLEVDSWEQWE